MRDWGTEIIAEVKLLQANQSTSSAGTTATEVGGGTGQSFGPEQERVRDSEPHEKGASIWTVRAASNSILGRDLSRNRMAAVGETKEAKGGGKNDTRASTGVQSRVTPLTKSREGNCKQHMANFFERPAKQQRLEQAKREAAATARCPKPHPEEGPYLKQSVGAEAQPEAQHAAAKQRCEGQDVLAVRCATLEGAMSDAEHTTMAGVADQDIATSGRGHT
jgi:hypothetical protein